MRSRFFTFVASVGIVSASLVGCDNGDLKSGGMPAGVDPSKDYSSTTKIDLAPPSLKAAKEAAKKNTAASKEAISSAPPASPESK